MHNTCRENLSKSGDSDLGSLCTQSGVSIPNPTSSLPFSENCVNLLLSAQGTPCTNILLIQRMRNLTARAVEGQNPTDTNWLDFSQVLLQFVLLGHQPAVMTCNDNVAMFCGARATRCQPTVCVSWGWQAAPKCWMLIWMLPMRLDAVRSVR